MLKALGDAEEGNMGMDESIQKPKTGTEIKMEALVYLELKSPIKWSVQPWLQYGIRSKIGRPV